MRPAPAIEAILADAVEIQNPADRRDFLDLACGEDPELRGRVELLIVSFFRSGSFLEPPPVPTPDPGPVAGARVGPYLLREQIGEGGMGLVFVADQETPVRRRVALKVVKPGMDSRQVLARFEAERHALALMDHPNIAKVLDAGATETGRPYFVMELVRGVPITDYSDQARLTPRQRLELFLQVCRAIQHAHQKGIIHRDLKPSNLLVTLYDSHPVPKVIDFGIAKAVGSAFADHSVYTGFAQLVGTPMYMSPEQAEMTAQDVDTRSDVYALGVVLYELLTGTTPFDGETLRQAGFDEMRRIIREDEPAKPSQRVSTLGAEARSTLSDRRKVDDRQLARLLRGELDWVVMTALAKDRNRRYESAAAFAADVERYLAGEAVAAHPPSAGYRFRTFTRRHRVSLAFVGLAAALIMILGWAGADWNGRRAATHRAVEEALVESADLQAHGQYPAALSAARRADGLAAGGTADRTIGDRAARRRADLELLHRLDDVRMAKAGVAKNSFDLPLADRQYAEVFRTGGIEIDGVPAELAANRIRSTTVTIELAEALDGWAIVRWEIRGNDDDGWRHLLTVAQLADPDPWRDRLRIALAARDVATLRQMADESDLSTRPASGLLILGNGLTKLGANMRAITVLRAAQRAHPGDFWTNHDLGVLLHFHGAKRPAGEDIRYLSAAVAVRPDSPGARLNLGQVLAKANRVEEALAEYRAAARLKPDYATAHVNTANALLQLHRPDEASVAAREALRLDPENAIAHVNLGRAHAARGRWDDAVAAARQAVRLQPGLSVAHYFLGVALCDGKRDFDGAISSFQEAIRLTPNDGSFRQGLGIALRGKGRIDEAIAAYMEGIRLSPDDAAIHDALGVTFQDDKGEFDKALACFREAVRLDPTNGRYHNNQGTALQSKGRLDDAVAAYKEALRLEPNNGFFYYCLGQAYMLGNRTDDAIAAYETAVRLRPDYADSQQSLGYGYERKGRPDDALTHYREAVRLDPNHGLSHYGIGRVLAGKGDISAAVGPLRNAVRLLSTNNEAHKDLSFALAELGLLQEAEEQVRAAIQLSPTDAYAHDHLGQVLSVQGRWAYALAARKKAVRLNPGIAIFQNNLAWLLATCEDVSIRDPKGAVAHAERAVTIDPKIPPFWNTLGAARYRAGDWKGAVEALTKSVEMAKGGDSADFYFLAMAHWQLGHVDEARAWFAKGGVRIGNGPTDPELVRFRAEAAELLGVLAPPPRRKQGP